MDQADWPQEEKDKTWPVRPLLNEGAIMLWRHGTSADVTRRKCRHETRQNSNSERTVPRFQGGRRGKAGCAGLAATRECPRRRAATTIHCAPGTPSRSVRAALGPSVPLRRRAPAVCALCAVYFALTRSAPSDDEACWTWLQWDGAYAVCWGCSATPQHGTRICPWPRHYRLRLHAPWPSSRAARPIGVRAGSTRQACGYQGLACTRPACTCMHCASLISGTHCA
jgi:hypothetical protein